MSWKRTKPKTLEPQDAEVAVHHKVGKLEPGTHYRVRLVAGSPAGTTKGERVRFKTKG